MYPLPKDGNKRPDFENQEGRQALQKNLYLGEILMVHINLLLNALVLDCKKEHLFSALKALDSFVLSQ